MKHYVKNEDHLLIVSESLFSKGDLQVTAQNAHYSAAACMTKAQAPAFALAVLEAAGYSADNSCAGDAIRSLRYQIANDARAAEEEALDKEAEALLDAGWAGGSKVVVWAEASENFKKHWRAVARMARELHKTEEAKA